MNFDKTTTHTGQDLGYLEVTDEMEKIGYESIHLYEDEDDINDFRTQRKFLVAFKAFASRADWYSNEAEILIRLHRRRRINNSALNFFDAPAMLKYQIPSKAVEHAYCQGDDDVTKDECEELRGLNRQSGMGEHSGEGCLQRKISKMVKQ